MYSIDIPDAVKQIYGNGSRFRKSDWYAAWGDPHPDRTGLFADQDIARHAYVKRQCQGIYSLSSLVKYETHIDDCMDVFLQRLGELAERDEPVDMFNWLQFYAFDVISNLTYSKRFGFLDAGEDRNGLIEALHAYLKYATSIGIFAFLHSYIYPLMVWLNGDQPTGFGYLTSFANEKVEQRRAERGMAQKATTQGESKQQDLLDLCIDLNENDSVKVTNYHVTMMGIINIVAGADTTAISLSAILFNLVKYPSTMRKLRDEIDLCVAASDDDPQCIAFKRTRDMPYLRAVIKEGLRIHAATGLPMWREVPEEGIHLEGLYFPRGTVVGLNAWCAHYNEEIFGKNASEFIPERWIGAEAEGGEKLRQMNAYHLPVSLFLTCSAPPSLLGAVISLWCILIINLSLGWGLEHVLGDT